MTSPYLLRPTRSLDQVTGRNVIAFPADKIRAPYERGIPAPQFLQPAKAEKKETTI